MIRFIYTPTRHNCDVKFFLDVILRHLTFQTFFSDVIRRHVKFQTFVYDFIRRHHSLCVENNTIFTQMLENNRPFIRNKRILCWGIKTAAESAILYYWPKCLSALARCLLKSMSAIDRIYCMLHAMQFSVYPITPHKGGPFYISLIRIFQTLPQSNNI